MSNIVFPCPACGTKYSVPPQHAGKTTTCKKCAAQILVPAPASASPTIMGSTRTIRRSDIEGAAAQAQPVAQKQTRQIQRKDATVEVEAPQPKRRTVQVDMQGGQSVMRKSAGSPPPAPVVQPQSQAGRFAPPQKRGVGPVVVTPPPPAARPQGGKPAPGRAPAGRTSGGRPTAVVKGRQTAVLPGQGPRGKKSNAKLFAIIGGVVALIAVIGIAAVASNPGSSTPNTQNNTAKSNSGSGDGQKVDPDQALLARLDREINDKKLPVAAARANFAECRQRKDLPEFKKRLTAWTNELKRRALADARPEETYAIAAEDLEPEGVDVKALYERVFKDLPPGKSVEIRNPDGTTKRDYIPDKRFEDAAQRLGYARYEMPEKIATIYAQWFLPEYHTYTVELDKIRLESRGDFLSPQQLSIIKPFEQAVTRAGEALQAQHDKDGFAINARRAFHQFLRDNQGGASRQRAFEPKSLGREYETVEDCWTYTYYKPFIVYIEKTPMMNEDEVKRNQEIKANILRQLFIWFDNNIKKPFNLQRVKPLGRGEQAENEGWPMEIVVLKDEETFMRYMDNTMEDGRIPGARAMYRRYDDKDRVIDKVISWDDVDGDRNPATRWFNESVLLHEVFHLLSDHYASKPPESVELAKSSPRYTSILIQEGLTDFVAGFNRKGDGPDAQYSLAVQNHLRLRSFQRSYNQFLNKKLIFRLQDMLRCTHYGKCNAVARERAIELRMPAGIYNWLASQGFFLGLFYETSCLAVQFLHYYKDDGGKFIYRDKLWKFIEKDYTGNMQLPSYDDPSPAISYFKELFNISSDRDWDQMNRQFLEYVLALTPDDVGVGGAAEIDPDNPDNPDDPGNEGYRYPPRLPDPVPQPEQQAVARQDD